AARLVRHHAGGKGTALDNLVDPRPAQVARPEEGPGGAGYRRAAPDPERIDEGEAGPAGPFRAQVEALPAGGRARRERRIADEEDAVEGAPRAPQGITTVLGGERGEARSGLARGPPLGEEEPGEDRARQR